MTYIDEKGNAMIEPDWSKWDIDYTEEVHLDNGLVDVVAHCRMYTESELALRAEIDRNKRITDQTAIALQLCVMNANLPDEMALRVEALYPDWVVGSSYVTNDIRRYKDKLYRALQNSTAVSEHTPDISTSLWKEIKEPDESGVFPWVQPLGATDAYNKGDHVSHNGKIYISVVDSNVWEPGISESLWAEEVG